MRYLYFFLFLFLGINTLFAQSDSVKKTRFVFDKNFTYEAGMVSAITLLNKELKTNPTKTSLNWRLGLCYLHSTQRDKAIKHLELAHKKYIEQQQIDSMIISGYYLAKSYQFDYKFPKAIETFEFIEDLIKQSYKSEKDAIEVIEDEIEHCKNGIEMRKNPVDMTVKNIGKPINSPYTDRNPILSANEQVIIFTSNRKGSVGSEKIDYGTYFDDIYISYKDGNKWTEPKGISLNINTEESEVCVGMTADAQHLLIYKNGDIYMSHLNGKIWTVPERLPEPINTDAEENHASISADGKMLYFTSNRKDGYGGFDIYSAEFKDGNWGNVKNLGAVVNTEKNEATPYIHPDGTTLFYSSEGMKSMGGYDVYSTTYTGKDQWTEPQNLGYPVNTPDNELFYIPSTNNKKAFYASRQEGGLGEEDIYTIFFNNKQQKELTIITGSVLSPKQRVPDGCLITVIDTETGEELVKYHPNTATGHYLLVLPLDKDYNLVYEAENHLFKYETFTMMELNSLNEINKSVLLKPVVEGNTREAYKMSFDSDKKELSKDNKLFVKTLSNFLRKNENLYVDISVAAERMGKSIQRDSVIKLLKINGIDESCISKDWFAVSVQSDTLQITVLDKTTRESVAQNKEMIVAVEKEEKKKNSWIEKLKNGAGANLNKATQKEAVVNEQVKEEVVETTEVKEEVKEESKETVKEEVKEVVEDKKVETKIEPTKNIEKDIIKEKLSAKIVVIENMLFGANKFEANSYKENIEQLADFLKSNPKSIIEIGGFSDTQGREKFNREMAQKRADYVRKALINKGVNPSQCVVKNYGMSKQISQNRYKDRSFIWESLRFNRRVEIQLLKKDKDFLIVKQIDVPDTLRVAESFQGVVTSENLQEAIEKAKSELKTQNVAEDKISVIKTEPKQNTVLKEVKETRKVEKKEEELIYSIMLMASDKPADMVIFSNLKNVKMKRDKFGGYTYYYGKFTEENDAVKEFNRIKSRFGQAFIFINQYTEDR